MSVTTDEPRNSAATQIKLRPATPADTSFILNSWLRSYWEASPFVRGVPKETFFHEHHALATQLLQTSRTLVAYPAAGPEDLIVGWACGETTREHTLLLHYVYVKEAFRRWGGAQTLVHGLTFDFNSQTVVATHLTPRTEHGFIPYSPYVLLNRKSTPL